MDPNHSYRPQLVLSIPRGCTVRLGGSKLQSQKNAVRSLLIKHPRNQFQDVRIMEKYGK